MSSGVLVSDAVLACSGFRVFFRGAVVAFLLLAVFLEVFLVAVFFAAVFLITGFSLMLVAVPRVLPLLVLATFFRVLRFFVFAGAACAAFLPVVPLMLSREIHWLR
ncbi:MAG: hypothetical protein ABFS24_00630 [Pseudomonadota bacterium]